MDPFYTSEVDDSTFSNWKQVRTETYKWTVSSIDFSQQVIQATSELEMLALEDLVEVVLDTAYLNIKEVRVNNQPATWAYWQPQADFKYDPALGNGLKI